MTTRNNAAAAAAFSNFDIGRHAAINSGDITRRTREVGYRASLKLEVNAQPRLSDFYDRWNEASTRDDDGDSHRRCAKITPRQQSVDDITALFASSPARPAYKHRRRFQIDHRHAALV